ncbi:MAG: NAD(P)H-dependent oxidoreductase [Rhodospirillaceae bacterium]
MKVVALVAHPKISDSRLHRVWGNTLENSLKVSVRKLYQLYPYWKIDVAAEQKCIMEHDRIVLQFPFYLYGCPPMMKLWLDEVLSFHWAYGPGGEFMHGKQILVAISTGGPRESYVSGGFHNYTVDELLLPFRQISNLVGATYLRPFVFHRARTVAEADIAESGSEYLRYVLSPDVEVLSTR